MNNRTVLQKRNKIGGDGWSSTSFSILLLGLQGGHSKGKSPELFFFYKENSENFYTFISLERAGVEPTSIGQTSSFCGHMLTTAQND